MATQQIVDDMCKTLSLCKSLAKSRKIKKPKRWSKLETFFAQHIDCFLCHVETVAIKNISLISNRVFGNSSEMVYHNKTCATHHGCAAHILPRLKELKYKGSFILYGAVYALLLLQHNQKFVELISTPINYWIYKDLTVSNISKYSKLTAKYPSHFNYIKYSCFKKNKYLKPLW
eukprot:443532_1